MKIKRGMNVKINPSIATIKYLYNCYFTKLSISKKFNDISRGREYLVEETGLTETTRDGITHKCIELKDFGWIPEEAIISCSVHDFLKIGYAFKTRDENIYLCAENCGLNLKTLNSGESYNKYNSNGTHITYKNLDIVSVYQIGDNHTIKDIFETTPVWVEYIPAKEMTVAEIEKELGYRVKVVDEDGEDWEF